METALVVITIISVAAAIVALTAARRARRREQERSEARVAALAAAAETHGTADGGWTQVAGEWQWTPGAEGIRDQPLISGASSDRFFGTVQREEPAVNRLPLFAAAALIVMLGGTLIFLNTSASNDHAATGSQVAHNEPLELVALGHARDVSVLTISGTVRNPSNGVKLEGLTAVVSLLDRNGLLVSTKDVPLDYRALGPGEEAPFKVSIPDAGPIARYRVSFRAGTDVVPHVDRRTEHETGKCAQVSAVLDRRLPNMKPMLRLLTGLAAGAAVVVLAGSSSVAGQKPDEFRFRSGVDLVNVTATVTDRNGRFVPGLRQDDFIVYEENELQEVTHFSNERVPVSLGIVLDTSGSMVGEKMSSALGGSRSISHELAVARGRDLSLQVQQFSGACAGLDDRSPAPEPRDSPRQRRRRYCDARRPGGIRAAGADRPASEAGGRVDLGRQRYRQPELAVRSETADSRIRSDGVRDRHRRSSRNDVRSSAASATANIPAVSESVSGRPETARTWRGCAAAAAAVPMAVSADRRVVPRFAEAATSVSTCTRCARSPTTAAAARKSCGPGAIWIRRRRTSPTSSAVSTYLGYSSTTKKDGRWHAIRVETRDKSLRVRARRGYIATP